MTNLSSVLIEPNETLSNATKNESQHEICLVSDSPHYVVRVRLICIHLVYQRNIYLRLQELEMLTNLNELFVMIRQN
jgi:hypothetical protein